ncbi:hypothetical protein Lgra_0204 [Legionella gratiana]|uniref:Small-conductance mechanosensitive channel n=1 Tax=Legionella gratiana TaxID=45066 RepID=A0A378JCF2_9GAMM|nr:mechanosensitive ion channel domain-containing protein [Legionella gratiana]KTD15538.1 hypothetical protein Lgra_0204 [Legionella gratiana]STX45119.1 Mechanosensitive ion channel [Legionella gratiana]
MMIDIDHIEELERAVEIKFPVSYTVDIKSIKTILLDLANKDKEIMEKPSPEVTISDFSDFSIDLGLKFWTHTHKANAVKNRLQEAIKQEFEKKEIEVS